MKRSYFGSVCAVFAALSAGAGTGVAQPPAPGGNVTRPAFSPYLNLTRPGGSAALNYYGLVRPELQFRQSVQNLQGDIALNRQAIGDSYTADAGLTATGHPTQFMNHGSYFLNNFGTAGTAVPTSGGNAGTQSFGLGTGSFGFGGLGAGGLGTPNTSGFPRRR